MNPTLSFYREKDAYIVNDDYKETLVTMCFKAGCGQEPLGKNGIAHLVEHICLAYRHHIPILYDRNQTFKEAGFRFSGYTNYGQTILMFFFPSHLENIIKFHQLLKIIMSAAIVYEDTFELSKTEILSECKEKLSQWYWQQELISFITDHQIEVLPVGRTNEIEHLQLHDTVSFIQNLYTLDNLALIFFTGVPAHEIIPILHPVTQGMKKSSLNLLKHAEYPKQNKQELSVCRLQHPFDQKIVEIYFQKPYMPVNLKRKLTRMLFEIISKTCIEEFVAASHYRQNCSSVSVSDKHVTTNFYYAVFTMCFTSIDDTLSLFAEEVASHLKQVVITEHGLSEAKESLAPFLSQPERASREQMFQNLTSHFFYGEPIHITSEHYKQIKETLERIEVIDILRYRDWILKAPCKIVIST